MMRVKWTKRIVWATFVFLVLLLALTGYFAAVHAYYNRVSPRGDGIQQLAGRIGIRTVRKCERNGDVYYLATGQRTPYYVLASGPPIYVFDSRGDFVEWIRDSGDQPKAMSKWTAQPCRDIPFEQLLSEINCHKKP